MEKVHGTSAHIKWSNGVLTYFSGGEKLENFKLFFKDKEEKMIEHFKTMGDQDIKVHGEAYGGKCQAMSHTYGNILSFIGFDVKIGESIWQDVPTAEKITIDLGLEFVPYKKIKADLASLDAERDADSEVAVRRGCGPGKKREGIVFRPLIELLDCHGERIIGKHKRAEFSECATPQKVVTGGVLEVLKEADAISNQWATEMRLRHVLDAFPDATIVDMAKILNAMVEDIKKEGSGEFIESDRAISAIKRRTALLFKKHIMEVK